MGGIGDIGVGNDRPVVGHLPRELSKVFWYFLDHRGVLECEVTGSRQRFPLVYSYKEDWRYHAP